jgi:thiol-disulfide isomerase/thioredoxin
MYVVAPPAKLDSKSTIATLRKVSTHLRGQITILAADPAAEEPGMTPTMYPIASTFKLNHTRTDYFVGILGATSGVRYTCNVAAGVKDLDAAQLIKCGEAVLAGKGDRMHNTQPAPENPKQGNFTVLVGSTLQDVVHDAKKDVLVEVYAPWCGACKSFAPEYAKVAAALAGIDSVVVAKMDGSENDHREYEIEEYPTLLFYPAEKGAKPLRVAIGDAKEIAEFVQKNAKIAFDLPDLAQFQDLKVDLSDFTDMGGDEEAAGTVEEHKPAVAKAVEEDDEYADPDDEEDKKKAGSAPAAAGKHEEL